MSTTERLPLANAAVGLPERAEESSELIGAMSPLPDRSLYEQLIADGVAAAAREHRTIDHITARRVAIWLANEPQPESFANGLAQFVRTGQINQILKVHLRRHARSGAYADRSEAAKLLEYCVGRSGQYGPVTERFGAVCDQLDRAEVMLAAAVERAKRGKDAAAPKWPDRNGPPIVAVAHHDSDADTVSVILDRTTANIAMFAIAAHITDREAHMREVRWMADTLPRGSFGQANRHAIADREARVVERLRAVRWAYRRAIDEVVVLVPAGSPEEPSSPEPSET